MNDVSPAVSTAVSTGRHPVNIGHLVMGLALLGLVGVWALWQTEVVSGGDVHWLMPVPWVVAGLVGLAATAVTGTRRHVVRQTGWVESDPVSDRPGPTEPASESEPPEEQS